jgi:FKBP-type peptidyl-prolyl cis-trans isomerase
LKDQRFFLIASLIPMIFLTWGMTWVVCAGSQTDVTAQPEKEVRSVSDDAPVLKTQKDQVNYAIGVHLMGNFKRQGVDVDLDMVIKGMRDASSGGKLLMSDEALRKSFMIYQGEVRRTQMRTRAMTAEENKKAGEAFLAENRKKEAVVTLPSGLQYEILKEGTGKIPTESDTVECRYRGTLINGIEFDNSDRVGRPSAFLVSGAIPGWREALKRMPVGSKWRIFVPPELAYGESGAGFSIGPNATLIFEIELLAIQ